MPVEQKELVRHTSLLSLESSDKSDALCLLGTRAQARPQPKHACFCSMAVRTLHRKYDLSADMATAIRCCIALVIIPDWSHRSRVLHKIGHPPGDTAPVSTYRHNTVNLIHRTDLTVMVYLAPDASSTSNSLPVALSILGKYCSAIACQDIGTLSAHSHSACKST